MNTERGLESRPFHYLNEPKYTRENLHPGRHCLSPPADRLTFRQLNKDNHKTLSCKHCRSKTPRHEPKHGQKEKTKTLCLHELQVLPPFRLHHHLLRTELVQRLLT